MRDRGWIKNGWKCGVKCIKHWRQHWTLDFCAWVPTHLWSLVSYCTSEPRKIEGGLSTPCGIFWSLCLGPFWSQAASPCSRCLRLRSAVRYFYAKICAIFSLSKDMDAIVFVGAVAVSGVVVAGAGLVGYLPNFFLSIIVMLDLICMRFQKLKLIFFIKRMNL